MKDQYRDLDKQVSSFLVQSNAESRAKDLVKVLHERFEEMRAERDDLALELVTATSRIAELKEGQRAVLARLDDMETMIRNVMKKES